MSLQAPPGHPAQQLAAIAAQFGNLKLTIQPPDADLKVPGAACRCHPLPERLCKPRPSLRAIPTPQAPVLTTVEGQKIVESDAIARYCEWRRRRRQRQTPHTPLACCPACCPA